MAAQRTYALVVGAKEERINLRVDGETKRLLESASEVAGATVSSFVLDAATTAARELLADRTGFRLDEEQWREFDTALSREPRDVPGLAELMGTPTLLDQNP
ncbi:DUF1778 domain-containing protein [Microbispora sp. H10670]|uniref:type II toxin-antitoxin system TacA family antitoxin n=1 Tax=Microbispora sp. H10670 TaxID=2729108 RepID=UPI00160420C4|nr:DUF1778 domain-containing protein [Microbispora sp. H10670]